VHELSQHSARHIPTNREKVESHVDELLESSNQLIVKMSLVVNYLSMSFLCSYTASTNELSTQEPGMKKKLSQRENVYSDYLAVKLGGQREVYLPISDESIDVLTNEVVLEIKYARSEPLSKVWGQVSGYWYEIEKSHPQESSRVPQIFPIWSIDRLVRQEEQRKYRERYRQELTRKSEPVVLLPGMVERDITPVYKITGFQFISREEISRHVERVKADFLAANYLCDLHREFIASLMETYRQVWHRNDSRLFLFDIDSIDCFGAKMTLSVYGFPVPIDKCIAAFMMLTHYELLSNPVGVSRKDIDKECLSAPSSMGVV
jgi:hypothetical protein